MSTLRSRFTQAVIVLVLSFVILKYGISPPAPWSVITLSMAIILFSLLIYVSSATDSWREFVRPMWETLVLPQRRLLRTVLVVAIPVLLGSHVFPQAAAAPH